MPPLKVFFLFMLVEGLFIAYVGTALFKIKATAKQLILIAFINAVVTFAMRFEGVLGYIIKYGLHTCILLITTSITISLVLKIPFKIAFIAAVTSIMLIILGDSILLLPVMKHFGMFPVTEFPKHPWLWILYGWISDGFLILTALCCWATGFELFSLDSKESKNVVAN